MSFENVNDEADRIKNIAEADYIDPLLIAPTGCGKSWMAVRIQQLSPRAHKPFIEVNCAEIPASLIESELFGYEKGAFTGAMTSKKGKFELADGGTIFLDEIGELPRELQAKLLKVIEQKKITRVGGTQSISVDVRIIYATHQDLSVFREDILYRISSYIIRLKPLRERKDEIATLAQKFIVNFNEVAKSNLHCSNEALECLKLPEWSGNIRQLRDFVNRVCLDRLMSEENKAKAIELLADDFLYALTEQGLFQTKSEIQPIKKLISSDADSKPYWESDQIKNINHADQELLRRYHKLAIQGKTNDEIGHDLGIKRSTLFYRLKRIKNVIAREENLVVNDDKKRWFYYWSRDLQSPSEILPI